MRRDCIEVARYIKGYLLLDMRLRIGFVNSGGPANAPAWIIMPDPMPIYGTRDFREQTVVMYIRKQFLLEAPSGTVVRVMAHELSHVLLNAVRHPLRRQEEAVDLTAMLLGFRNVFIRHSVYRIFYELQLSSHPRKWYERLFNTKKACNVDIVRCEVGYLSREEREYAAGIMERWK